MRSAFIDDEAEVSGEEEEEEEEGGQGEHGWEDGEGDLFSEYEGQDLGQDGERQVETEEEDEEEGGSPAQRDVYRLVDEQADDYEMEEMKRRFLRGRGAEEADSASDTDLPAGQGRASAEEEEEETEGEQREQQRQRRQQEKLERRQRRERKRLRKLAKRGADLSAAASEMDNCEGTGSVPEDNTLVSEDSDGSCEEAPDKTMERYQFQDWLRKSNSMDATLFQDEDSQHIRTIIRRQSSSSRRELLSVCHTCYVTFAIPLAPPFFSCLPGCLSYKSLNYFGIGSPRVTIATPPVRTATSWLIDIFFRSVC